MVSDLKLQDGDKIGCVDKGLVFGQFIVVEYAIVGPLGEDINPRLDGGVDTEFNYPLGGFGVEATAEGVEQTIERRGNTHVPNIP